MKKSLLSFCLMFPLMAHNARAAITYWDPTGTTGSAANTGGSFEGNLWSTAVGGTASPVPFVEGTLAVFSAGVGGIGNTFTVTASANHTVAGIFNGGITGDTYSTNVTINGDPGVVLSIVSGFQGFSTTNNASTTINAVLGGTGGVETESGGSLYLYGTNIYSGGTFLATSAGCNFNNPASFGTGLITNGASLTVLATPSSDGHGNTGATGPFTVTNAVKTYSGGGQLILVGLSAAPVTFSGPWTLTASAGTPAILDVRTVPSTPGTAVWTISGPIGGAATLEKINTATLVLGGASTYSGGTIFSNGIVSVTADNNLGTAPGSATLNLTLGGGTFNASNTFTLNSKRLISLTAASTISVSSGKTMTYGGVISGSANLTKAGTGTLALSGANGYTGTTTISAGTIEADSQSGSSVGNNSVALQASGTLSGTGIVSGAVSGAGTISPGTSAGPGTLTLGNGLDLSSGGTYAWKLSSNNTATAFSQISLIGGNLNLNGTSKLSINFSGTASAPSTTNAFWQTQQAWTVVPISGSGGNSGVTKFTTLVNGTYAAGNFTNLVYGNGNIVLLYQPNFPVFDTLYDSGPGFFSGENLILTNFSGLALSVWSSTNSSLAVSNWTLVGSMQEQPLAPALPGYSRYSINVVPTASPTYYLAGNMNTGAYIYSPVPVTTLTTSDFTTFTVNNASVAISTNGVLALQPALPVILPGSTYSSAGFQLQFSAGVSQNYTVHASTDLINWTNVGSGTVSSSPVTFTDPAATNISRRYYRISVP